VATTSANLAGTFRVRLDLSSSSTCELCERPGAVYESTHLDVSNITQVAIDLRDSFDGACNVPPCVSVNHSDPSVDNSTENIVFDINFDKIYGDHPQMTLQISALTGDSPTVEFETLVQGSEASGTFSLTLNGSNSFPSTTEVGLSTDIEWDADSGNALSGFIGALQAMSNVGGNVEVSRSDGRSTGGFEWLVTFDASDSLTLGNLALLECNATKLEAGFNCTAEPVRDGVWINGSFALRLEDPHPELRLNYMAGDPADVFETARIASDATAAVVEDEIEGMDAFVGDVTVTRAGPSTTGGYSWTVTFNELNSVVGNLTLENPDLQPNGTSTQPYYNEIDSTPLPTSSIAIGTGVFEVQNVTITRATGGTFTLRLDTSGCSPLACDVQLNATTAGINPTSTDPSDADSLESRLAELANVAGASSIRVERTHGGVGEVEFMITFVGQDILGNIPTMGVDTSLLTGASPVVIVTTM